MFEYQGLASCLSDPTRFDMCCEEERLLMDGGGGAYHWEWELSDMDVLLASMQCNAMLQVLVSKQANAYVHQCMQCNPMRYQCCIYAICIAVTRHHQYEMQTMFFPAKCVLNILRRLSVPSPFALSVGRIIRYESVPPYLTVAPTHWNLLQWIFVITITNSVFWEDIYISAPYLLSIHKPDTL